MGQRPVPAIRTLGDRQPLWSEQAGIESAEGARGERGLRDSRSTGKETNLLIMLGPRCGSVLLTGKLLVDSEHARRSARLIARMLGTTQKFHPRESGLPPRPEHDKSTIALPAHAPSTMEPPPLPPTAKTRHGKTLELLRVARGPTASPILGRLLRASPRSGAAQREVNAIRCVGSAAAKCAGERDETPRRTHGAAPPTTHIERKTNGEKLPR